MNVVTVLGLMAATCTTGAYVPQVVKAWRSRSTRDVSLGMFGMMFVGMVLWLIYGAMVRDLPLITANVVALCLAGAVLFCKLRYG